MLVVRAIQCYARFASVTVLWLCCGCAVAVLYCDCAVADCACNPMLRPFYLCRARPGQRGGRRCYPRHQNRVSMVAQKGRFLDTLCHEFNFMYYWSSIWSDLPASFSLSPCVHPRGWHVMPVLVTLFLAHRSPEAGLVCTFSLQYFSQCVSHFLSLPPILLYFARALALSLSLFHTHARSRSRAINTL